MKTILIDISYTDETNKFWCESSLKNKVVFMDDNDNVHKLIKELCYEKDYMKLSYKGKPKGNIYIDTKDGDTKRVGYMYRGHTEIDGKTARFDVWVTLREVIDFEIEDVDKL